MTEVGPYRTYVEAIARLHRDGQALPLGGATPLSASALAADAPQVLIFSPHPDDECIIGSLALRLQREAGFRVVNVAVTQGSNPARREGRWDELAAACAYLGIELVATVPGGLERINARTRAEQPDHWRGCVDVIATILAQHRPAVILCPHETDWNSSHVGTHLLVMDALARQHPDFTCHVVETEFWGAMATPNLMVECSTTDLADLLTALSCHVGEVQRNPYHLLVPAWMQDNVRRGGEVVGGQGGAAPDFVFATIYRLRQWRAGALHQVHEGGRTLPVTARADSILAGPDA
ncbi:MAG: PIG-L family deacetylase [Acidobacteria bacterium]|nr:PIG-L family deacetylase [Acidobacteriota bacterium]